MFIYDPITHKIVTSTFQIFLRVSIVRLNRQEQKQHFKQPVLKFYAYYELLSKKFPKSNQEKNPHLRRKTVLREKAAPQPQVLHPTVPVKQHGSLPCDKIWTGNFKAVSQLWNCSLRVKGQDCLKGQEVFSSTTKQNNRVRLPISGLRANQPKNPKTN